VALVVDPVGLGTANQVQDGVRKAARALDDAGYAVDEVEPPSIIDVAAKTLLGMLNTPDVRAGWQLMSPSMPADTQRFVSAFYEVAGDPDPVTTVQSFIIRQSLLRGSQVAVLGCQELQQVIYDKGRPDNGLENSQNDRPEPIGLLNVINQSADQAQTINGVSPASAAVAPCSSVFVGHAVILPVDEIPSSRCPARLDLAPLIRCPGR